MLALTGTLIISAGAIVLTGDPRKARSSNLMPGITYGVLTAMAVATYTLWDAYAMSSIRISPLLFQFGISISRFVLMSPLVLREKEAIRYDWKHHRGSAILIAILSPASYFLILIVLGFTSVTYVAPLRTLSILIGVILGTNLLKESDSLRRVAAGLTIVCGVILLNIA
jgi:drug/metabolite transporter (DMT)-like permease